MSRNHYIAHKDQQVFPPPIRCGDVHLYAFFAKADPLKLQRWVDRWFNHPSRGELAFETMGPLVMITFQEVGRLQSLHPAAERVGYVSELEACIWLPIRQAPPREPIAGLALPWIWPDSSLAVATGRELYGFRKEHSWIRMPTEGVHGHHDTATTAACAEAKAGTTGATFQLVTLAFRVHDKDTMATRCETLRIERIDPPAQGPLLQLGQKIESMQALLAAGAGLAPFANLLCHFANLEVPMLMTKQFRQVDSSEEACHLSVVECRATDLDFASVHYLLGSWRLVVQQLASQPIADDLGLALDGDGAMDLEHVALKLQYSFNLDRGRCIWRAPEDEDEDLEIRVLRALRSKFDEGRRALRGRLGRWGL